MSEKALQTAIQYAEQGWYVFPIKPGSKYPYKDFKWRTQSTCDPEKVKLAGRSSKYKGSNWALDCGRSSLFIVDVDNKSDANGYVSLSNLPEILETGFQVKTPSGGLHYYFTGQGPNGVSNLGPGLDTRGAGGYVLIPGSTFKGKAYETIGSGDPAPLPQWLSNLVGKPAEKKPDQAIPLTDYDQPHNIEAAIRYLREQAPEAIEGSGGDIITYQVACHLRDMGLSQDKAAELLLEIYNPNKAHPPWSPEDLAKKVDNAYRYAKDRPGNSTPDVLFPDPLKSTKVIRCDADCDPTKLKPREWILGYRYLREYITLTIAPGGVGKSLLTILEGLSIATGRQLTHDAVHQQGAVWLYNTEDPLDEIERRIEAIYALYKISRQERGNFFYSSGYENPIKLVIPDDHGRPIVNTRLVDSVIEQIKKRDIVLFIVDPFVECHSVNENDNSAIAAVVQVCRRIAKETRCAVALVHHTSKGKHEYGNMDKARGASALIYGARIAHTLYPMTKKESTGYGIPEHRAPWFVRLDDAKANLAPPTVESCWYEKKSVKLFFDSDETTGALAPVKLDRVEELLDKNATITAALFSIPRDDGGSISLNQAVQHLIMEGLTGMNGGSGPTSIRRAIEAVFVATDAVPNRDQTERIRFTKDGRGYFCLQFEKI